MTKFTTDQKLSAVMAYREGKDSMNGIAKSLGVAPTLMRNWVKQFDHHGPMAFSKPYTTYPAQFKLDVLQYMKENGVSANEAAAIFNIASPSSVWKWERQLRTGGQGTLIPKKKGRPRMKDKTGNEKRRAPAEGSSEALQAEIDRLRMENEYPKKVERLSSIQGNVTKEDKVKVIYELRHKYPVKALVEYAGIKRSTYYVLVKKIGRPDPDTGLKAEIQAIYDEHEGRYGYRRIRDELQNRGQKVNHKRVQRLMKALGLKCLVRLKKYKSYRGAVGEIADNILDRDFKADAPNEKWVTDISEFKLFGERLYLSPVLDLFNGEIITYTIGSRPTYSLVSEMLENALSKLPEEHQLLIHSDQGWHYQMRQFRHTLKEKGIVQSMSRKGNCHDNAVMENFFGIMKSEFLYLKRFKSIDHFKIELGNYIDYYNTRRIKAKLKLSPVQYRTQFVHVA
ncbi:MULTISPECIES: IS3 family transposase [unclassified Exiguobacterium]|uniref:IS3 family transposase n=2 Tax=Exiguobacterium TaxID=33986 RepID=UPI00135BDE07|nr:MULTISPECIES: IS3 family transposase [unclassified Exiguobacterium]